MKINTTYFKLKERHIYGSSCVGVRNSDLDVLPMTDKDVIFPSSNVISEMRADIRVAQDYSPFGVTLDGRDFTASGAEKFRYGFNGKEMDNEVSGNGNQYDYGFRIYNPRLGKFLSIDPLTKSYPWYTPYQFAGNKPIAAIDIDGLEEFFVIKYVSKGQLLGIAYIQVTQDAYISAEKAKHNKLVLDVKEANEYNQQKLASAKKNERPQIQALIDKNNADVAESERKLNELQATVEANFSKTCYEEIDVSEGGVGYNGISTLRNANSAVRANPSAYSQGKNLSDKMALEDQNVINIGAPAIDKIQRTKHAENFNRGSGYLGVNIPQSMNINFETNSSVLPVSAASTLDAVLIALTAIPDMRINLVGHTDSDGSADDNLKLSQARAEAAKQYLVSKGIDPSRILTSGMGESQPVSTNSTVGGKATNRRIEIIQN